MSCYVRLWPRGEIRLTRSDDVVDLALQHIDDGIVAQIGVRAAKHEQVREAAHGDAGVRRRLRG
jgi:hypothetical protein